MRERRNIRFKSQDLHCAGWFYPAAGKEAPCIILAHGFGGTKESRLDAYAEAFADAGYHALVFDYRHFGESEGEPRQILDIKKQQEDWHAAIRFAKGLPGVEPERIILWGTSFSGGHVVAVAVKETGIVAVISQVPHLDGMATTAAAGLTQTLRLGIAAWCDLIRMALKRSPYYVPIFGKPGELAAMTSPGAAETARKLYPEGYEPNENVAARIFFKVGLYSPGRLASRLTVPWLVQVAAEDLTTPVKPAIRAAMEAKKSQLVVYKCDHFDVYVPPRFSQTVEDQITFLRNCLR